MNRRASQLHGSVPRRPQRPPPAHELHAFLAKFRAAIIVLSGGANGMEYVLDQRRISLGRGPGVDLALDSPSLRTHHADLEFAEGTFLLRNLAGAEGTWLNHRPVEQAALKHGDRFVLGRISFSFEIEMRSDALGADPQ